MGIGAYVIVPSSSSEAPTYWKRLKTFVHHTFKYEIS